MAIFLPNAYLVHFDYTFQLSEDKIFCTAKIKLIHIIIIHAIKLVSGKFDVLTVIYQLLPARVNHIETSTFSC